MGLLLLMDFEALLDRICTWLVWTNHRKEQEAAYIAMCIQWNSSSPWGYAVKTYTNHPPPIRWKKTRRRPITACGVDTCAKWWARRDITNSQKGPFASRFWNILRRRGRQGGASFLNYRPTTLSLEDTAGRKIHFEAVMIGSICVELNHLIEICK